MGSVHSVYIQRFSPCAMLASPRRLFAPPGRAFPDSLPLVLLSARLPLILRALPPSICHGCAGHMEAQRGAAGGREVRGILLVHRAPALPARHEEGDGEAPRTRATSAHARGLQGHPGMTRNYEWWERGEKWREGG